jgi:predicted dehydrogenase
MKKKIKIGILGTANIAIRSMIPAIDALSSHFQLYAIASRSESQKVLSKLDSLICNKYFGYEYLIEDKEVDAVYIPLPNSLHAEWIERSLKSGKHVFVEKSLGCSLSEVVYLTELAKKNNLILLENFQFRFHPQLQLVKDLINSGKIGELRCLRASFGFPPFSDPANIRYNKILGGGALLDACAYTTKISQILLGFDLQVKASTLSQPEDSEVDIWGGAYLQSNSTCVFAELAFGFDNFYQCGIEVWGNEGRLITNRLFTAPSNLEPEIIVENKEGNFIVKAEAANHFEKILIHFYNLIIGKENIEIEHIQNIDQSRLLNSIKELANVK